MVVVLVGGWHGHCCDCGVVEVLAHAPSQISRVKFWTRVINPKPPTGKPSLQVKGKKLNQERILGRKTKTGQQLFSRGSSHVPCFGMGSCSCFLCCKSVCMCNRLCGLLSLCWRKLGGEGAAPPFLAFFLCRPPSLCSSVRAHEPASMVAWLPGCVAWLPSFLPSVRPSFLPFFLPSFLPSPVPPSLPPSSSLSSFLVFVLPCLLPCFLACSILP